MMKWMGRFLPRFAENFQMGGPGSLRFATAGGGRLQDHEPWGKAVSFSILAHAALLIVFLITSLQKRTELQTTLTEINFVEKPAVVSDIPEPKGPSVGEGSAVSGGELGTPGQSVQGASHPEMANAVPFSSPQGRPEGAIVAAKPIAGPIAPSGSNVGLVGQKKGLLAPLAGRTEGPKAASGTKQLPTGSAPPAGQGTQIALGTQNVTEIRNKPGAPITDPLIKQSDLAGAPGTGGKIKGLPVQGADRKKVALETLKPNPLDKDKWGKKGGPFSLEGPLKYRKILKMELPPYPRWAEEQGLEATVSFRLWVDPRGKVKDNLYLEKASGYSELDNLVKETLKKFQFVPLPEDQPQEDEWGVATFHFELKKK